MAFVKLANYEILRSRKYKNDIGKIEHMNYLEDKDVYICKNNRELSFEYIKYIKSKTGHVREKHIYKCQDCSGSHTKGNVSRKTIIKSHWKNGIR